MKPRETPYRIIPVHNAGYYAPAMYVYAGSYEAAKKEAASKSTLFRRFPEVWRLI